MSAGPLPMTPLGPSALLPPSMQKRDKRGVVWHAIISQACGVLNPRPGPDPEKRDLCTTKPNNKFVGIAGIAIMIS